MNHQALIERSHKQARDKGFWEKPLTFDMAMALIISEIAEALEAYRKGRVNPDWNDTQAVKDSFEVEIADAIIRIYDWCGGNKLKLTPLELRLPEDKSEGRMFMELFERVTYVWFDMSFNHTNKESCFSVIYSLLLKYCEYLKIDIEKYIMWKLDYNLNRPYKHGKQF